MELLEINEIKITNRGMITIPRHLRSKYNLQKGQKLKIIDRNGEIVLIPLLDLEKERPNFVSIEELMKSFEEEHQIEIELENRSPI
jgi:AbrB family looped-hinge helix DNA binding protein